MKKKIIYIIIVVIAALLLVIGGLFVKLTRKDYGYKLGKKDLVVSKDDNIMAEKCVDTYCVDYVTIDFVKDNEKHYIVRTALYNSSEVDLDTMNLKITLKNKNNPIVIYKCLNNVISNNHYSFEEVIPASKKYEYKDYTIEKMNDDEANTYCIND